MGVAGAGQMSWQWLPLHAVLKKEIFSLLLAFLHTVYDIIYIFFSDLV